MVIEIHGFPGAGKTTVLTMIAQRALQGKSTLGLPKTTQVFTSFPCVGCYQLDFFQLGKLNFHDCLIIIDEISLYADNRNFKNFSDALLYFFKLHRHANISLVWCSQSATDADKKIRGVTEKSYIIDAYGIFTAIKPIEKWHSVRDGEPKEVFRLGKLRSWKWCCRPHWYKYFDSYDRKPLPDFEPELWECDFQKSEPVEQAVSLPEHELEELEAVPHQNDNSENEVQNVTYEVPAKENRFLNRFFRKSVKTK